MNSSQKETVSMVDEVCTFYVGDAVLGINILNTQEINKLAELTRVPLSSDKIEGVMNLRGNIVTVLNTGKILELPSEKTHKDQKVIIVESKGEYIGLIVDAIADVVGVGPDGIKSAPSNIEHMKKEYFHGVLEIENQLIGILDADKVIGA